jgi:3-oxoacyl-[acyl-carrier protein] reductase
MNLELAGKTAIVLGASYGLGAAAARALLREGATVFAAARDANRIKKSSAVALPADQAARVFPVAFDLNARSDIDQLAATALSAGPVDILVNSSGGPPPGPAHRVTTEQWRSSRWSRRALASRRLQAHGLAPHPSSAAGACPASSERALREP